MVKPLTFLRRSLRAKLVVGTVVIIIAVVGILTFVLARNAANLLDRNARDQLAQLLKQSANTLASFLAVQEVNLDLWVAEPVVHSVARDPALGAVFLPGLRDYFADYTDQGPWIENVFLIKDDAVVYAHKASSIFPEDAETRSVGAKQLLALPPTGLTALNLKALHPQLDQGVIAMKRQLMDEGEPVEGAFILLLLDLEAMQQKLFAPMQVGKHGFLALAARINWEAAETLWIPQQSLDHPERADFVAARDQGQLLTDTPSRYQTIVLDHRQLDDVPLAIVGVAAWRDVREPVIQLMLFSVGFGLVAVLLGTIGTFIFSGKLTAPIRLLTTKARQFAAGELQQQTLPTPLANAASPVAVIPSPTVFVETQSHDEIGELTSAFNQMAADIGGFIDELAQRNALARSVSSTRDLDAILSTVVQTVANSGHYDHVRLYLVDECDASLVCQAAFGLNADHRQHLRLPLTDAMRGHLQSVFLSKQPAVVEDAATAPQGDRARMATLGVVSSAAVPLLAGEKALGVLAADLTTPQAFSSERLNALSAFANTAALAIDNALLYSDLQDYSRTLEQRVAERTADLAAANAEISALNEKLHEENLRLGAELEITRQIQQMLLPTTDELQEIDGLDIACYMEPADEVGGDYYDVLQHNGQIKIGIGDVTGHGLESGVIMVMTQAVVRALLTSGETDHVRFLDTLNRVLYKNVQRMGTDKNLTLSLLDYAHGEVKLSGQHEEMIVVRRGGVIELVNTMDLGFPIALDDAIADFINAITIQLAPGDGVVLYTDGITEAENMGGEQYGLERLCNVVRAYWAEPAEAIKEAVVVDVRRHIGDQEVYDDITLVVVKQT